MKLNSRRALGVGALAALSSPLWEAPRDAVYEPKPGSGERRAIFAALRPPVQKQVKRKVIFVGSLKASRSGWAVFNGSARYSDGSGSGKAMSADEGWGSLTGVLRKSGGRWRVTTWGFATDTSVIEDAMRKHPQAPRALFR